MSRFQELKRLDRKSRNILRSILSSGPDDAIKRLAEMRKRLGRSQAEAFESVLSATPAMNESYKRNAFPRRPPFADRLCASEINSLESLIIGVEREISDHKERLYRQVASYKKIDLAIAAKDWNLCLNLILETIKVDGWSHSLLRKLVLVRVLSPIVLDGINDLMDQAGLGSSSIIVASLLHVYSEEQNYLTIKRSILNIADRGYINRYSRIISRIAVQPLALTKADLTIYLSELSKCALIDRIICLKINSHLYPRGGYLGLIDIINTIGEVGVLEVLLNLFDPSDSESEGLFYKRSSAWLEYMEVRNYRVLIDVFYDASREGLDSVPQELRNLLDEWVGYPDIGNMVSFKRITLHSLARLGELEVSGRVTRSALYNYWLHLSGGQVVPCRQDIMNLMGITRDLARTVPIAATRAAASLSSDRVVKLVLLLLLAKRSKNELDSFQLRKILEDATIREHEGSLVRLLEAYEKEHSYISEYIYEIATEDFLAKLSKIVPHLPDIPNTRASLHEWMARRTGDNHFNERARAVRIDHQLNRVRNEIDDNRIYVDPARFSSWIQDEMMIEIGQALVASGNIKQKNVMGMGDEVVLSLTMRQCYTAFCSNAQFGIASYIGRRIRHGTFHGYLYSGTVNQIESNEVYSDLLRDAGFVRIWTKWKNGYNNLISEIVRDKLHVYSKAKPLALLQPELYSSHKQEIVDAAVNAIMTNYSELYSTDGLDLVITDYCWRLAEHDLDVVTKYLISLRSILKQNKLLDELVGFAPKAFAKAAVEFRGELNRLIDNKLTSICGWFKRPSNVAPKASIGLLYEAVVREIKDTLPNFNPRTEDSPNGDIELVGGVYHIMYDSLAVVISNAAKYGDPDRPVLRNFCIESDNTGRRDKRLIVEISSFIRPGEDPDRISEIIEQRRSVNCDDANLYQGKSGIPKLLQLEKLRDEFSVNFLGVVEDKVCVRFSYALEH